jgi:hypothetical protein
MILVQDPGIYGVFDTSGNPISSSNPIRPGQTFIVEATGLGNVVPPVPSGQPGPSNPPAIAAISPVVNGNQTATVSFAGLAPGGFYYQINATAPANLSTPVSSVSLGVGNIAGGCRPPRPYGSYRSCRTSGVQPSKRACWSGRADRSRPEQRVGWTHWPDRTFGTGGSDRSTGNAGVRSPRPGRRTRTSGR